MPPRRSTSSASRTRRKIVSAHRTPEAALRLCACGRGARPQGDHRRRRRRGAPARHGRLDDALPVLGVPVESQALKGMDSLLSIVQMPAGVPVGTLAIGKAGAINAALLAAAILATSDAALGAAARCVARGADRIGAPKRPNDRSRPAPPSASSAAASSAGCWRWPRRSSATACHIFDPPEHPCAADVAGLRHARALRRRGRARRFGAGVDVATYEFENLPVGPLDGSATSCGPATALARRSRRTGRGESFIEDCGVPGRAVARRSRSLADLTRAFAELGTPVVLKTRRFGYDGKGQAWIHVGSGRAAPGRRSASEPAVAEAGVDFAAEFSVILARWADGRHAFWDSPENPHRGRHPPPLDRARAATPSRGAGRRGARRGAADRRGARPCRRDDGGIFRERRRAACQRDRAARPQQRPLDDRGRGHLAIRAAHPRDLRPAARRDRVRRAAAR